MLALAKKKKKPKKKKASGATGYLALVGVPEQVAMEPPARASRQRSHKDTMCINCGCVGHFRSEWEAPQQCPTTLAYLGYETERGSFYFVDAEIEEEVPRPHLASVTLAPEQVLPPGFVILADLIRAELAAYISDFCDSEFMWEVTQTAPLVFSVPFPSAELLRLCSHDFICCPTNEFLISVHAAKAEPELDPPLEKVWVLVYGLPRGGRWHRGEASLCTSLRRYPSRWESWSPWIWPPLRMMSPEVARSKARGEAYPVVSVRYSARLSQSCLLLDGRVPTMQEKTTMRAVARDLSPEVATDSGIVFQGEKGPILEQITTVCAKDKLEGALAEARASATHGEPSSHETTDPCHRETRGGAAPLLATVAGTSLLVSSPLRALRGRPPYTSQPHGAPSRGAWV
ncbi:hypothetical protein D1007_62384 [Hordeum vulgare]|nr:hypothetical protein D1007_62384 [Hordeum vulgare]